MFFESKGLGSKDWLARSRLFSMKKE